MINPEIIKEYFVNTGIKTSSTVAPPSTPFKQNLDVVNYDFVDCVLNSSMFSAAFVKERKTKHYINTGLMLLNSLNFDLGLEIAMFKKTNGVVNMSYAAALYIGGMYHLLKTDKKLEDVADFMPIIDGSNIYPANCDLETKKLRTIQTAITHTVDYYKSSTLPLHGYGVGNNLYNEWNYFVKNQYITNIPNTSCLQVGNLNGDIKSFKSGKPSYVTQNLNNDFLATYSILKSNKDFGTTFLNNSTKYNNKSETSLISFAYIKDLINKKVPKNQVLDSIKSYIKGVYKNQNSEELLNLKSYLYVGNTSINGDTFYYDANGIDTVALDRYTNQVYNALELELSKEIISSEQFSVLLFPSAGGLFNDLEVNYVLRNKKDGRGDLNDKVYNNFNETLLKRSFRFVWAQSNLNNIILTKKTINNNPKNPSTINRLFEVIGGTLVSNNQHGYYGADAKELLPIKNIQDLINLIGLHNMETMEDEFIKWTSDDKKEEFTDKFHFTSLLKAIMIVDQADFGPIVGINNYQYTVDEQLGLIYTFNGTADNNSDVSHNINAFLTSAQHTKIEKVTKEFLSTKIGINNYTTVGLLRSNDVCLYLDNAPYRRELLFSGGNILDNGFILRKLLLGDQDLGLYPGFRDSGVKVLAEIRNIAVYEPSIPKDLINKYFKFSRPSKLDGGKIYDPIIDVSDFCKFLNLPITEDILRVLHPFISTYMYNIYYSPTLLNMNQYCEFLILKLWAKEEINNFLRAYQSSVKIATDPTSPGYLLKQNVDKDELIDLKTGTYYSVRAMFDNNIYAPNKGFFTDNIDSKFSDEGFIDGAMFYNFSKERSSTKNSDGDNTDNCDGLDYDRPSNNANRAKHLYEYVNVVDRANKNVGYDLLANIMWVRDAFKLTADEINPASDNSISYMTDTSYFSFLSGFATEHNCLLHPLSSYVNLAATEKDGESLFGMFNTLERVVGNPALIIQYIGDMESILQTPENKNTKFGKDGKAAPHKSFCMDIDFLNNQVVTKTEEVPADIMNGNVSCFVVDFGAQEQQIFKSIQIDTSQFTNTEESIKSYVNLVSQQNQKQAASSNLFKILTQRSYNCTVEAMGNVMIQPLSYFYIKNVPLFTGAYWIINVSHKLEANVIKTTFKGVRQPVATIPNSTDLMIRILKKNLSTVARIEKSVVKSDVVSGVVPNVTPSETIRNEIVPLLQPMNIKLGRKIMMIAQATKEGFYGDTPARRNNNPGNLVAAKKYNRFNMIGKDDNHAFTKFNTLQDGLNALSFYYDDVFDPKGNSNYAENRNPTLIEYISIYAPKNDKNDPDAYSLSIVGMFRKYGVTINVNMPLKGIVEIDKTDAGSSELAMVAKVKTNTSSDIVKTPKTVPSDIGKFALPGYENNVNGRLNLAKLKKLDPAIIKMTDKGIITYMYPAAAEKLEQLVKFVEANGHAITISSVYRDYEGQEYQKDLAIKAEDPGRAATPGYSNHGYGLAVDIHELNKAAGGHTNAAINKKVRDTHPLYLFLNEHAAKYNFYNPDTLKDGIKSDEAWHWEYHV